MTEILPTCPMFPVRPAYCKPCSDFYRLRSTPSSYSRTQPHNTSSNVFCQRKVGNSILQYTQSSLHKCVFVNVQDFSRVLISHKRMPFSQLQPTGAIVFPVRRQTLVKGTTQGCISNKGLKVIRMLTGIHCLHPPLIPH